jgi:hypothetical protein
MVTIVIEKSMERKRRGERELYRTVIETRTVIGGTRVVINKILPGWWRTYKRALAVGENWLLNDANFVNCPEHGRVPLCDDVDNDGCIVCSHHYHSALTV